MAQEETQGLVKERIKLREKLAFGLGDMASNVVWAGVGAFVTFYYTNSAGLAAAAVGTMFLVSRIFDGFSDIVMGLVIDRTKSRFGKARPWLLWMAVPFGIVGVLVFSVPTGWSPAAKLVYAYITYNLLSTVVYTAINLPYGTMTALITDNSKDRTILSAFRMTGTLICVIVVSMIVMPMVEGFGSGPGAWQKTFGILSGAAVVLFLLCFLGTKERVGASTKKEDIAPINLAIGALLKNKYWYITVGISILGQMMTGFMGVNVYYAKYWLGNEGLTGLLALSSTISMLIGLVSMPALSAKFGKRNMMLTGNIVTAAGALIQSFAPTSFAVVAGGNIIRGFGTSPLLALGFVMYADVIDYGEWKTGIRTEGLTYSASSFGAKVGAGLGAAVLGWALAFGKFDAALAVQDAPAMNAIRFVFIFLPMILCALNIILLIFYNLDKELPAILAELNKKHQGARQ
ncbi:MAG: glycoside-pentoside-hexuronide (GPH):cation symporter [Treponemataceae bacterium]|nr:MAG: glycoside-pentoside-hexuronide (GPH):cation symporter [Treponemataceae bacterium]